VTQEIQNDAKKMKAYEHKEITTQIAPATTFFKAEAYHQLYLDANPNGYCSHKLKVMQCLI
jgi:peptide-methionine (S)-S-oxide reductase